MKDQRIERLAKNLLEVSTKTHKDDTVVIRGGIDAKPLILELVKHTHALGAHPHVFLGDEDIRREILKAAKEPYMATAFAWTKAQYEKMDVFISIMTGMNDYATVDVPRDIKTALGRKMQPLHDVIEKKRWVALMWPTPSQAQKARMANEPFFDHVVDVSTVDYGKMKKALEPLKKLMEATDKVRIKGPGTDLSFSIKDIPVVVCAGENNIPDGEIFTAPVKESVEGTITFNTESPYMGDVFKNVRLTFAKGRIVDASHEGDQEALEAILDTDEGARRVGEFALGVNPRIETPMGNILFDEKIQGSLHFTPGMAYSDADNGNRSAVHWDLVLIQRAEYGGGEILFDDTLIRKDGLFVKEELKPLNPENLDTRKGRKIHGSAQD